MSTNVYRLQAGVSIDSRFQVTFAFFYAWVGDHAAAVQAANNKMGRCCGSVFLDCWVDPQAPPGLADGVRTQGKTVFRSTLENIAIVRQVMIVKLKLSSAALY